MEHSDYMMIWKISLFCLLLCVTVNGYPYAVSEQSMEIKNNHKDKLSHVGESKPEHHDEYAWSYPSYEFSYKIKDPHTHDEKGHQEERDGDEVRGEYWLIEPDGRKRTVYYNVEKHSGFNAIVKYSHPLHHKLEDKYDGTNEESSSDKDNHKELEKNDVEKGKKEENEESGEKGDVKAANTKEIESEKASKEAETYDYKKYDGKKDEEGKKHYEPFHGFMSFPNFDSRIRSIWEELNKKEEDHHEKKEESKKDKSDEESHDDKKDLSGDKDHNHEEVKDHKEKEKHGHHEARGKGYSLVKVYVYKKTPDHDSEKDKHEKSEDGRSDGDKDSDKGRAEATKESGDEGKDKDHDSAEGWPIRELFGFKQMSGHNKKHPKEDYHTSNDQSDKSYEVEEHEDKDEKIKDHTVKGLGAYANDASDHKEKGGQGGMRGFSGFNKRRGHRKLGKGSEDQDREGLSSYIKPKSYRKTIENYNVRNHSQRGSHRTIAA